MSETQNLNENTDGTNTEEINVDEPVNEETVGQTTDQSELNTSMSESNTSMKGSYEVVFFAKYNVNPRPSIEDMTKFFETYGTVHHINYPVNKNYAFIFMSSLSTPVEHRRTRTTISQIIREMTPGTRFHITVASSNRRPNIPTQKFGYHDNNQFQPRPYGNTNKNYQFAPRPNFPMKHNYDGYQMNNTYQNNQKSNNQRLDAPRFGAPKFSAPRFDAPRFDAPRFDAPKFSGPRFSNPKFDGPRFNTSSFDNTRVSVPKNKSHDKYEQGRYNSYKPKYES